MVWNLFPFKGDLSFGKARSHRAPNLGCSGAESPGWFDVSTKNSAWDMMHEWAHCYGEVAIQQLPISAAFWIIPIVCAEECLTWTQNLMQICCSACSVILNVTATQGPCSLNSIYQPHWLVQWSCHCSRMCIPICCPWLPDYIEAMQTVLIILTMARLFPGQPHVCVYVYIYIYIYIYMSCPDEK